MTLVLLAPSSHLGAEDTTQLYWGDTHVHTVNSLDASATTRLSPADAFRFARGEEISQGEGSIQLRRRLDFLVVADHAEFLGIMPAITAGDVVLDPAGKTNKSFAKNPNKTGKVEKSPKRSERKASSPNMTGKKDAYKDGMNLQTILRGFMTGERTYDNPAVFKQSWQDHGEIADRYNKPGSFSAMIGFEWTSNPQGNNLHRVVVFKDGAELTSQVMPFSQLDSQDPVDLWQYMSDYEEITGGNVLAIPHNGNLSNGEMFRIPESPADYAAQRARWEPLVEISQIKGNSETHPLLSPEDEFAGYRTWDRGNLWSKLSKESKDRKLLAAEYVRNALLTGIKSQTAVDVNPFQFGFIGSSDSHLGRSTVTVYDLKRNKYPVQKASDMWQWEQVAGGLAGVWAEENSRASLFEAMERRETYATSGSRITLRMFAGDFKQADLDADDRVTRGYSRGVPMGSELTKRSTAPTFMVWAVKDPMGANLDRIQIVKGWVERDRTREKVYDVVWSGDRQPNRSGKLPDVGNTVNSTNKTFKNTIGATSLAVIWTDPDFNSAREAFYYVRVIEIPTPRFEDFSVFGIDSDGIPMSIAERAWSSPVWYTP